MKPFVLFVILATLLLASCTSPSAGPAAYDWQNDWALQDGFSITRDTQGYHYPTAIAFVPNPGKGPQDPLYFVTEIAGSVKVVTNDRSVYTFVDGFDRLSRNKELPDSEGQLGTAGICLDPAHGYVFVTFLSEDDSGIYHNSIVRFETVPGVFSVKPASSLAITEPFSADALGGSGHQIGPCQIQDNLLYVGIGDSIEGAQSQQPNTLVGKIARMTLDGLPAPGNPFRQDDDASKPINYVWASGFRNPFGLKFVSDQLFVADNGNDIDRFVQVQRGQNYLWDGSDWSIGANANFIFSPSIAPAQMDVAPSGLGSFAKFDGQFFLTGTAYEGTKRTGVVTLDFDLAAGKLRSTPSYFLRYTGNVPQAIVGLAFGPDGLYLVPVLPDQSGITSILKVASDPGHVNTNSLDKVTDVSPLMFSKGCYGCHSLNGSTGAEGPSLDKTDLLPRLQARLSSPAYRAQVDALDRSDQGPIANYRAERQQVLAAQGMEQMRLWITFRLQDPRFDNPNAQMPNLGLSRAQAESIADYLTQGAPSRNSVVDDWYQLVPLLQAHLLVTICASFVAGALVFAAANQLLRRVAKRRT